MIDPENTRVAVLMGGWSAEREVSLASGQACTQALEKAGFKVTPIDAKRDIARVLADLRPDVAFNALHGKWGEDGTVQGVLEGALAHRVDEQYDRAGDENQADEHLQEAHAPCRLAGMRDCLGVAPVVGIPLPLMSYGGNSILTTMAGLGLLLNIKMRRFMLFY